MSKVFFFGVSLVVAVIAAAVLAQETVRKPQTEHEVTKATYLVTGLHCPPCTRTVESSLSKVKGIRSIKVDWKAKNARVEFDEHIIPAQTVAKLIADTPNMMGRNMHYGGWLILRVPKIKDDASARPAKDALAKVEGVKNVVAYPKQHSIGIRFTNKGELTTAELIAALKQAGIEATIF